MPALWQVHSFDFGQRVPAATRWTFDNRTRSPATLCVLQAVRAGALELLDAAGRHTASAGQAVLFRWGEPSRYGLPDDARETLVTDWICLMGAGLTEHWAELIARHGPVLPFDGQTEAALRRLAVLADPAARADALTVDEAAHALVRTLWRVSGAVRSAHLSPVERAIEELLGEPWRPGSLTGLARRHGISREHLAREFHRRQGLPARTWVAERRLERAEQLLRSTSLTVAAVARQCGFASAHVLARGLRRRTGHGPRALRDGGG